ncbi:MAG: Crp/Fnr family transcriptional regulator [Acidobacteria bacterium]|nr:Crp/Fnr family transcriptional regulator [Acidobacteriota bacterium]
MDHTYRSTSVASVIREHLIHVDGVRRLVFPKRGATIYTSGTIASHIYFLESGLVKLERTPDAERSILISMLAPGTLFGEQALIYDNVYTTTATMLESGVVYACTGDLFLQFCARNAEAWTSLTRHLLDRKDELERKIEHLCLSDVKQRVLFYLGELARLYPGPEPDGSVIHISQNELASYIGATRETTSTTLNALARQGLIALGHRLVMIPSVQALGVALEASRQPKVAAAAAAPNGT